MELRVEGKEDGAERGSAIMSKNKKKSDKMFRFQNLEIWKKNVK